MILERINNWFNLSKQYFFSYKNGFFYLSYLANSPELIVKSLKKMPFMKIDNDRQIIYSDNPFVKGEFSYVELETGLWVMNSRMFYKNNVAYTPIYDKYLPSNYYCITINCIESDFITNYYKLDNFKIESNSISILKPDNDYLFSHFKGSKEEMYIFYIDEDWVKKNIINSPEVNQIVKDLFLNSEIDYINFKYNKNDFEDLIKNFSCSFTTSAKPNVLELKRLTYNFFELFFSCVEKNDLVDSAKIRHKEIFKIEKIEQYLMNNLYSKFPGIVYLSKEFKVSPTQLKLYFKIVYGTPIFKYFQQKQMSTALNYVTDDQLKIKEIAQKFGYENVSKFSKSFQNHHKKLPSEYRK